MTGTNNRASSPTRSVRLRDALYALFGFSLIAYSLRASFPLNMLFLAAGAIIAWSAFADSEEP